MHEIAPREDVDFVRDEGRLFYGSTFARYEPLQAVADPLPASALLAWSLEEAGVLPGYAPILRAIQRRTRVHANAWSVKWDGSRFAWEVYHPLFPPTHTRLYGREMHDLRASEWIGRVGWFLDLHDEVLRGPGAPSDPATPELPGFPYALSFPLEDSLARTRRIDRYSICAITSPPGAPLPLPVRYEGYGWRRGDREARLEQVGVTLEPFEHREAFEDFLTASSRALFGDAGPADPRAFLHPWLVEDTGRFRVGASRKVARSELGVYYCGVRFSTLRRYLDEFSFPAGLVGRVAAAADRLAHLCFDVLVSWGISGGSVSARRTSFYGMF